MTRSTVDAAPIATSVKVPPPTTLEACHEVIAALVTQLSAQAARRFQLGTRLVDLQELGRLKSRSPSKTRVLRSPRRW